MKTVISTPHAPAPIGPYSQAIKHGNMVFTSGQIAIEPSTNVYTPREVVYETQLVMENLKAVLAAAGTDFSQVVKASIFLADMRDFPAVNEVYGSYFSGDYPARETVQVSVLPKNAKVEISLIAYTQK